MAGIKERNLPFRVHILSGKILKIKLLPFPDLIVKYFFADRVILIAEMLKLWMLFDVLPDARSFYKMWLNITAENLNMQQLIFLLMCRHTLSDELERYCEEEQQEELDDIDLYPAIVEQIGDSKYRFSEEWLDKMDIQPHFFGQSSRVYHNSERKSFFIRTNYKRYILELFLDKQQQKLEYKAAMRRS